VSVGKKLGDGGAQFLQADLVTDDLAPLVTGVDIVFHLAALSAPWGRTCDFEAVNITATERLIDSAKGAGCGTFIYASTPSIYAEPRDRIGITEDSAPARRFANAYAATKYAAEKAVLAANALGFRTVSLRPRAIVGQYDSVLLPRLLRLASKGRVPLPGGGKALVELTDARDVAMAFVAADRAGPRSSGKIYNISSGQPRQVKAILTTIFEELGKSVRLVSVPTGIAMMAGRILECAASLMPGRPEPPATRYSVMTFAYSQTFDLTLASSELDWKPSHTPEDAVRAAIEGMRSDA